MATKPQEKNIEDSVTDNSVQEVVAEKAPKFKKEELLAIFDEMIFSGEYTEEVSLRGGKLKVRFKSRSVEDTTAISRNIDSKNFTLVTTLQEHRALMNLAYSLVSYANTDLTKMDPDARTKYINKLPAVVVGSLSEALNKFDEKISAACMEGEVNF